jgi:hypothetical protein
MEKVVSESMPTILFIVKKFAEKFGRKCSFSAEKRSQK